MGEAKKRKHEIEALKAKSATNNHHKKVLLGLPKGVGGNPQDNLWGVVLKSRSQARSIGEGYSREPKIVMIGIDEKDDSVFIKVAWEDEAIEKGIEFQPITESLSTRMMGYAA